MVGYLHKERRYMSEGQDIKPGYTRVSDFCARYEDFSSVDPDFLQSRADVGTHVHSAIRCYMSDVSFKLTEEEQLYFDSWLSWYKEQGSPAVIHEEERMYCDKWMLTGAIDGILIIPDTDIKMIVDWKTSSSVNNDMWPLKGAFYHYLVKKNNLCDISDMVYYLKLSKTGGKARICQYEISDYLKSLVQATMLTHRFEEKVKEANEKKWGRR